MNGLGRRLDALERIAERCRIRALRDAVGDAIVRRSREHGLAIPTGELGAKIDRALAIMETSATLLAAGLTLEGVARHLAVEHGLDPDRVVALYRGLRARREGGA
jgi:hypothetical protein